MIYEVVTTEQADADLWGIYEYIAFELLSIDKGTKLQPYISIKDAEDYPTLPYFYVDTVEHDTVKKTTKITAYDAIYLASKRQISEVSIEYPTTLCVCR